MRAARWSAGALPIVLVAALSPLGAARVAADEPATGPGSRDSSFGTNGRVTLGGGFRTSLDDVVVQPDGKIVAGFVSSGTGVSVYRLTAAGAPDPAWNGGTPSTWSGAGTPGDDPKAAIAQDAAGRTYVASALPNAGHPLVAVRRLSTDGTPDATWGTGGVVTADLGGNPNDHGTSLAVDPETGRVYVGVWQGPNGNTDFGVLALTSAGAPDTGFGDAGLQTTDFNGGDDTVRDIVIAPGGDVVAIGFVKDSDTTQDNTGAWRLNSNGSVAPDFGGGGSEGDGKAEFDLGGGLNDGARSVAVDDYGYFFVSAYVEGEAGSRTEVLRLDTVGGVDPGFGGADEPPGTGSVRLPSSGSVGTGGVTVDAAGRVVAVGADGIDGVVPTVARLVADRYAEDTTFNGTGFETLTCPDGAGGGASAVAVQPNGRLVVAGTCAGTAVLWRLDGRDQVPLSATPVGISGPGLATLTASEIDVDDGGRVINATPGETLTLSFSWDFDPTTTDDPCDVACIEQVVAGFVNRGPALCDEAGTPEVSGGSGTLTGDLTAPDKPGRYYLAFTRTQYYGCYPIEGPADGFWTGAGRPWDIGTPEPATYLAEVNVVGVTGLSVSADEESVPFGHRVIPVDDVPVDALAGSVGSLQSAPLRASPLRASPLRASPLRASPLRASPLRASPLRASPLRASPLRASPIPLSQLPLAPPHTWAEVLAGTVYASRPLQDVTLQQVLALSPAPPALAGLTLADVDLSRTPLRNVSLVAFLLGNTPSANLALSGLPDGTGSQSLLELELAGTDLSSVYAAGVSLRGHTLVDAPIASFRLGDLWLSQTPLGAVPLSLLPASWYDPCQGCTTLADVQRADVDHGIKDAATVGALLALAGTGDPTVGSLLPGIVARDELGYEQLGTQTLAAAAPLPDQAPVHLQADFSVACPIGGPAEVSVAFDLPPGFRAVGPGTVAVGGTPTVTEPTLTAGSATLTAPLDCAGTTAASAELGVEPGVTLGPVTPRVSVSVAGGAPVSASADASLRVVDPSGDTPLPESDGAARSTVFLGYVSEAGDRDAYTLPAPPAGSQLTVRLGRVPAGSDDDLSVFGPDLPDLRTAPLRASPLRASPLRASAVDDTTLDPGTGPLTSATEPQPDVPLDPPDGSAVIGISASRGNADESVVYRVPEGADRTAPIRIVVSGYNGTSDTTQAYTLLVSVTPPVDPPPCATPNLPFAGDATAHGGVLTDADVAADRETLILANRQRLGDLYGSAAATAVMAKLGTLAARDEVKGVVIPVDGNAAVRTAYAAWDADPCSPAAANSVVGAINAYVDSLRGNATGLKHLVLVGGDQAIPMARVQDRMDLENEASFAGDQVYDGKDNPLSGSLRAGYVLTDDPYGDVNPIPWLDGQAFVPDLAIGRLVETPADITRAVDAFITSNGVRSPTTAYTAGYDFNADGAEEVRTSLAAKVGSGASRATINGTWTKYDALLGLAYAKHGFASVNAHYDTYRALPADQDSGGTANQLLTTADLPGDLADSVLFTIGCHAGLNVADTFVAATGEAVRKADWAQTVAARGGTLAGNTGYGYGDTEAVAYSERLMADLAANLDGRMTVGQALMFAKQSYLHLPLSVVDAKVMAQATFYGLPMYKLGAGGESADSILPVTPAASGSTATGDLQTVSLTPVIQRHDTARGSYYTVGDESPLAIPGRPLQPQAVETHPLRSDGLRAHGVVVEALETHLVSATGGFDPVYSVAAPDSSTTSPEPATVGSFFPAAIAGVVERAERPTATDPSRLVDAVTLAAGQFRSGSPTTGLGFQQLADTIGYKVRYSASDDVTPATISSVDGTISGTQVTFTVTTPDDDAIEASVLFLVRSRTSPPTSWTRVTLTSTDGHTFRGTGAVPAGTTLVEQFFVQLVDGANNVSVSSKKGQDFSADSQPADAPHIALSGTPAAGAYIGEQTVTITSDEPEVRYTVDSGTEQDYTGPFVVSAAGTHTVTASNRAGSSTVTFTIAGPPPPTVTITSPSASTVYVVGADIPAVFQCTGYAVTSCTPSPPVPDSSFGTHRFTVIATSDGDPVSASVTYTVQGGFVGVFQPINDGPFATMSVFKKGSTVPVKFRLTDNRGQPIPDATAAAIAASCGAELAYSRTGTTAGQVDEPVFTTSPDSNGCFRYDSTGDQFVYNLGTKNLTTGTYTLRIRFPAGASTVHTVDIGLR